MDASNSSSMMRLSASSTYDDQGLRATLLLGLALLVVFIPPVLYLTSTNVLWIKRLYRTNHTVEPTAPHIHANRSTATTAAAAAATDFPSAMDDPSAQALNEVDAEWWKLYSSSPVASTEHLVRSTGGDGQSRSVVRRKRLGISLPVSSTLLSPPSWSDLCSVEEEIAVRHGVYLSGAVEGEGQEASPSSPSRHVRSYGSIAASNSSTTNNNNNSGTLQSAAVHADTTSAASFSACGSPQSPAPRTFHDRPPLDPQVSLYLFSLKYFAAVMLLGSLFTMWIPFLTAGDDYFEAYQVRRDARRCHAQDLNESGCNQLRPYCEFRNSTMFDGGVVELLSSCHPVPLRGLYDLTVQNVRPRSWRWWPIAILNVGFATVCALLTVWAVRKVDVFIAAAMKRQLQSALGYRVVCVRGLQQSSSGEGALSATHFIERYLNVATYFGPSAAAADGDGGVGPSTTTSTQHYYEELYCSGLDCIFSILNCVHSIFEPADAVFAEPQRVREVLVTRHPPRGIYRSIRRAEKATLALQEAIAEDKALKRRWRAGGASPHIIHNGNNNHDEVEEAESEGDFVVPSHGDGSSSGGTDGSEAVYMVRGPCPSCCICCPAVPAVPLREAAYRAAAADLNQRISQVAHQRTAGGIFVIFSDCLAAFEFAGLFEAARRFHGGGAFSRASIAGPPSRIIENNLHTNRLWLTLRLVAVLLVFIVLLFTWSIPVGFLGSLDSLAYVLGPRAEHLVENPFMRNLITAYLPVLVLALFNLALPVIIRALVIAMGAWNKTECDGGHLYLQYLFMVLTGVVFQAALQGGLAQLEDLVVQPNHDGIINFFVACVTPQGGYWYAKVVMALCLSAWLDLLDPIGFLKAFLLRQRARTQRQYAALFAPCKFEYPKQYSFDLTILSMGLLFHMTVPILGLLVGAYGVVRYYTQRAKLMDRYRSTLATAQECSDFGVTAQVMRSVAWLWVLSDTGNLLLVSLHGRSGAMVLNSLSLSIALIVLCYVHLVSRRWVASLNNVRRIFPDGLPVAAATRQGSSSFCGGEREEGGGRRQQSSHNHDEDEEEEEGIMDAYESASMFALEEDARQQGSCPFWQRHVLPRRPGTSSRYRPKHQRLAIIDVEAEVQRMHDAKFPVQRFWDRSMTWFEEDHHE